VLGWACCLLAVRPLRSLIVNTWSLKTSSYSYYLGYHNAYQIIWGLFIGAGLGILFYLLAQVIPDRYPASVLGRAKIVVLDHPIIAWLQIRDGWAIWADGGREVEWLRWKTEWEVRKNIVQKQKEK
jgi:dolichyldiphosphatase